MLGPSAALILAWPVITVPLLSLVETVHPRLSRALAPRLPLLACLSGFFSCGPPYTDIGPSRPPTTSSGTLPPSVRLPTSYDSPALSRVASCFPGIVDELWPGQPSKSAHCPVGCSHTFSNEV